MSSMNADAPIFFYDGDCGLCARSVQWVVAHDRRGVLRYAPLQGATFAKLDVDGKPRELETMALHDAEGLHVRSDGVLRVLRHVGGPWSVLAALGRAVPRFVREAAYDYVAR